MKGGLYKQNPDGSLTLIENEEDAISLRDLSSYSYDFETADFVVLRNRYTGTEVKLRKQPQAEWEILERNSIPKGITSYSDVMLRIACPVCGHEYIAVARNVSVGHACISNSDASRFCGNCGTRMRGDI